MTVNPGLKLWCCAALLALCLLARTRGRRWRCFCSVRVNGGGGVRPRAYLSLLRLLHFCC
ncbi:MAG: hypothetical protein ACLVJ8_03540 [Ruthenibacterium lactatiformans]